MYIYVCIHTRPLPLSHTHSPLSLPSFFSFFLLHKHTHQDYLCFDATQYGSLMIVDSEDRFRPEEVAKIQQDVAQVHIYKDFI